MSLPWKSAKAIDWLRDEAKRGHPDWRQLCSMLAARAAGYRLAPGNANQWAARIPKNIRNTGTAPAGCLKWWEGGTYGHVAWSLGGGYYLCNGPDGRVRTMPESYYSGISPSFWVDPMKHPEVFRGCSGDNPEGSQSFDPNQWSGIRLVPGTTNPSVPALRLALTGEKGSSLMYGARLKNAVIKVQKRHPNQFSNTKGFLGENGYNKIVRSGLR